MTDPSDAKRMRADDNSDVWDVQHKPNGDLRDIQSLSIQFWFKITLDCGDDDCYWEMTEDECWGVCYTVAP